MVCVGVSVDVLLIVKLHVSGDALDTSKDHVLTDWELMDQLSG